MSGKLTFTFLVVSQQSLKLLNIDDNNKDLSLLANLRQIGQVNVEAPMTTRRKTVNDRPFMFSCLFYVVAITISRQNKF